jgi:hypothetical protein
MIRVEARRLISPTTFGEEEGMAPVQVGRERAIPIFSLTFITRVEYVQVRGYLYADLAVLRVGYVLALGVNAHVVKSAFRPPNGGTMQLRESSFFHFVAHDSELGRVPAGILVKAGDREQEVLI